MSATSMLRDAKGFSENERAIAQYLLAHPEEVSRLSSRELARRTYTSPSAVLRFCKRLGFSTYGEFKADIVSELKSVDLASTIISDGEHAVTAMNKMAALESQVVAETKRKASPETLDKIAQRIAEAPYVDIFARDTNATIAEYASHNFFLAGRICTVYQNLDRMVLFSYTTPQDHTALVISKSGADNTLIVTAQNLRERKVPVVVVTADVSSPLAKMADYVLEGFYYPEFYKFGDVVFSAASKYLFDVLFVMVYSKDYRHVRELNDLYDEQYYGKLDRSKRLTTG